MPNSQDIAVTQDGDSNQRHQIILDRLLKAHEAYFDTYRNRTIAGRFFPGYAEFHTSTSNYVLVKRAKLWEVNSHEYLFIQMTKHLTPEKLEYALSFMKNEMTEHIKAIRGADHMSSIMSLVLIASSVDDAAVKMIKHTRYRKNFNLGFSGWTDLRLAVIDLSRDAVYTNPLGKALKPTLEANLAPEAFEAAEINGESDKTEAGNTRNNEQRMESGSSLHVGIIDGIRPCEMA